MIVELGYGLYSNSLGLISDSFHMLADCLSLLVALIAGYISMGKADNVFTYGYDRVEVISGFFNGIFLVFVAFNVFCESIERIYEPQYVESDHLLLIAILGLLVNIVGLVFFHEHAHIGHSHDHKSEAECPMHKHNHKHSHHADHEEHSGHAHSHHDHSHSHDSEEHFDDKLDMHLPDKDKAHSHVHGHDN